MNVIDFYRVNDTLYIKGNIKQYIRSRIQFFVVYMAFMITFYGLINSRLFDSFDMRMILWMLAIIIVVSSYHLYMFLKNGQTILQKGDYGYYVIDKGQQASAVIKSVFKQYVYQGGYLITLIDADGNHTTIMEKETEELANDAMLFLSIEMNIPIKIDDSDEQ